MYIFNIFLIDLLNKVTKLSLCNNKKNLIFIFIKLYKNLNVYIGFIVNIMLL